MRLPLLVPALFLAVTVFLPAPARAQSPCPFWDGDDLHVEGKVGGVRVSVFVVAGYPAAAEDGVAVVVMDHERWTGDDEGLDALLGTAAGCQLTLKALNGDAEWALRVVSRTQVVGTRTVGARSEPLVFERTRPFDCAAGPWKAFDAAGWPVTFEYPAWGRADSEEVVLACPDLSRVFFGATPMLIDRVPLATSVLPDGRRRTTAGVFFHDGSGRWLVNDRDEEECRPPSERPENDEPKEDDGPFLEDCRVAGMMQWRGFTVLAGSSVGTDRQYLPGGGPYAGLGSGTTFYLILLGDEAIQISSSASDFPALPTGANDRGASSDRSTERMAHRVLASLKRR
jgi:hypothetical protein